MAVIWTGEDDPRDPIIEGNELRHNQDDDEVCVLCGYFLDGGIDDSVMTRLGPAHEDCAEKRFPYDPGDTRYPR